MAAAVRQQAPAPQPPSKPAPLARSRPHPTACSMKEIVLEAPAVVPALSSTAPAGSAHLEPATLPRSEPLESLLVQIKSADSSGIFRFTHRELDGVSAAELLSYLRDACRAKFVDLSCLNGFTRISAQIATTLWAGLRSVRSLTLDGNDLGSCGEIWEAWCVALEEHPGLQRLSLKGCGLLDRSAMRLARVLVGHLGLFSVDLTSNRIGDDGVEAITGAITENHVLLEVSVGDIDASIDACNTLEAVLDRNRGRFGGQGGCAKMLRGLRRARAEAVTALACGAARTPAVGDARSRGGDLALAFDPAALHPSTAVAVGEGQFVWLPLAPSEVQVLDAEARDDEDAVFFDAGNAGVAQELLMRCEAGWRNTVAEAERLHELQGRASALRFERQLARDRMEVARTRMEEVQRAHRQRAVPLEERLFQLKEQLAFEVEGTKVALQSRIQATVALKRAEEEFDDAAHEKRLDAETFQKAEHGLKLRHREVAEAIQDLKAELHHIEDAVQRLEHDNEHCRRLLHAARFETETERFVPHRVLAALAPP